MQTETREPVLRVVNLVKRFGNVTALTGLNLQVLPGEVYGLLGPNGAGKSTLIGSILGLVKPNGGAIEVFGQDARHNRSEVLRRTGAVIESPAFYPYMGGSDNLQVVARTIGGVAQGRIDEMLELVGLGARGKDKVKTYSTGMRQRLGLASVLLGNPDLVILDEPTSGLDVSVQARLLDLVRGLVRQLGIACIIVTHDLGVVRLLSDRLMVMRRGRVVEQGLTDQVLDDPQHAYTQLLVSSILPV